MCESRRLVGGLLRAEKLFFVLDRADVAEWSEDVGEILSLPTKSVYDLPIPRVRISRRRIRWRPTDVRDFIGRRIEGP